MRMSIFVAAPVNGSYHSLMNTTKRIPARLSWLDRKEVIKGTPGSHGDAGWTLFEVPAAEVASFLLANRAAAMPCWQRFDANGNVVA